MKRSESKIPVLPPPEVYNKLLHKHKVRRKMYKIKHDMCSVVRVSDSGDYLTLARLIVKPGFRGQGAGTQVLEEIKKYNVPIRVYPFADNQKKQNDLLRFYTRAGFKPLNNLTGFYVYAN